MVGGCDLRTGRRHGLGQRERACARRLGHRQTTITPGRCGSGQGDRPPKLADGLAQPADALFDLGRGQGAEGQAQEAVAAPVREEGGAVGELELARPRPSRAPRSWACLRAGSGTRRSPLRGASPRPPACGARARRGTRRDEARRASAGARSGAAGARGGTTRRRRRGRGCSGQMYVSSASFATFFSRLDGPDQEADARAGADELAERAHLDASARARASRASALPSPR